MTTKWIAVSCHDGAIKDIAGLLPFEETTGYKSKEMIGKSFESLVSLYPGGSDAQIGLLKGNGKDFWVVVEQAGKGVKKPEKGPDVVCWFLCPVQNLVR